MSSPIDDNGSNDRLKYAPPWARQQLTSDDTAASPAPPPDEAAPPLPDTPEPSDHPRDLDLPPSPTLRIAESPETAPRAGDPAGPWLRAPARPFEGDRAVRELRARMALNPHAVPEPPELKSPRLQWKSVWRALGITAFATAAAFVVVIFVFPEAKRMAPAQQELASPTFISTPKADRETSPEASRTEPPRLVLIEKRSAMMNEPVPLGVTLAGGSGSGAVLISGLAAEARLSAGAAIGSGTWRVPLADLGQAEVIPPNDFIGIMDIAVALLATDAKVVDKSAMHIEWAAADEDTRAPASERPSSPGEMSPSSAPLKRSDLRTLEREEIESLVKRGRDFIANGDLAAARLVLRRAANGGDAQAALLLGTTFDPATFEKLHVIGAAPDPTEARNWYQRAIELGSTEAERRIEPLASGAR